MVAAAVAEVLVINFLRVNLSFFTTDGLLDYDAVFIQQSRYRGQGEFGSTDAVVFRIDGVVECGGEIGTLQVGMVEGCIKQVALIKNGIFKISFGEVHLLKRSTEKYCVIQFHLEKGGVIELTFLKADSHSQLVTILKMESQHFTLFENRFLK